MKYLHLINDKHWLTEIESIRKDSVFKYRVTSTSNRSHIQLQTFCNTVEEAKKMVSEHMNEVRGS